MSSARDTILGAIGTSGDPAAEYEAIERTYQFAGLLSHDKKLELFIERLLEYGAGPYRCGPSEISAAIAVRLNDRGSKRIVVPSDIPPDWLPDGIEFLPDRGLEQCDGALTGCAVAISDTGTIILDGTRAFTLLPDYHLCVVFENQIYETVPEAMQALAEIKSHALTFISGPSATADIEMTRIQGVHGPRSMDVLLVSL